MNAGAGASAEARRALQREQRATVEGGGGTRGNVWASESMAAERMRLAAEGKQLVGYWVLVAGWLGWRNRKSLCRRHPRGQNKRCTGLILAPISAKHARNIA